jgi:hypothetical protein
VLDGRRLGLGPVFKESHASTIGQPPLSDKLFRLRLDDASLR